MSMSVSDVLPPHLFSNIFSRLDVKSLLRYMCVSKPICSLIDSPPFINSQLRKSLISNTNRAIFTVSRDCTSIHHLDFNLSNPSPTFVDHPFISSGAHFLASCNGLFLLLSAACPENCVIEYFVAPDPPNLRLVLVNPATRNYNLLPISPIDYPVSYSKTRCDFISYGLGYDSVNNDYKVVRIAEFADVKMNEVKICSLKFNEWTLYNQIYENIIVQVKAPREEGGGEDLKDRDGEGKMGQSKTSESFSITVEELWKTLELEHSIALSSSSPL